AREFAREVALQHHITFAVRVGISTGPAVIGEVGTELLHEYTAMGDAVNVAARLQAAAPPMGILIAEATYRGLGGAFECIDRGQLRVRSKAEAVRTYEVRAPLPAAGGARAASNARRFPSPFVGRSVELGVLNAAFDRLAI